MFSGGSFLFVAVYLYIQAMVRIHCSEECFYDSDCGDGFTYKRYCCRHRGNENNTCKSDCIGEPCTQTSDCAPWECCSMPDSVCKFVSDCRTDTRDGDSLVELDDWIIVIIIIGVLLVVFLPILVALFFRFRSRNASRRQSQATSRDCAVVASMTVL